MAPQLILKAQASFPWSPHGSWVNKTVFNVPSTFRLRQQLSAAALPCQCSRATRARAPDIAFAGAFASPGDGGLLWLVMEEISRCALDAVVHPSVLRGALASKVIKRTKGCTMSITSEAGLT